MSELTYGATRERLIAAGYAPASALSRDSRTPTYETSEDPAAVLCLPTHENCRLQDYARRGLVCLIVQTRDKARRAAINAVIERHGFARGPVRVGSDGSEHRPLRFEEYQPVLDQSTYGQEPDVIVAQARQRAQFQPLISGVIRLDGEWHGGGLLTTSRTKLPAIDESGIAALIRELNAVRIATAA